MPFDDVLGQMAAVETLERALTSGKIHHAYRFEGPVGVGKEYAALRLARALVCTQGLSAMGCGDCSACRRALSFSEGPPEVPQHPDIVLVARGLYTPHVISAKETAGISVEQIRRVVLGRSHLPPHEAERLVFIIRDADELGQSAANALLKTLEEPHSGTHFILLTSRPQCLLETIRSRTQAVRFGTLPDSIIKHLLEKRGLAPQLVEVAAGSMTAAISLADPEQSERMNTFASGLSKAMGSADARAALEFAADLPKDKTSLKSNLHHTAQLFSIEARKSPTSQTARDQASKYLLVQEALAQLDRNVSQQLVMEALVLRLRRQST